ncbi:MAG: hypothetical protein NTW28_25535 [Candidatus Solibacter sp.]|nr:hypothetical protein [Candidatus Solibacter sp.]MCX6925796.1 hypothetical protein [Verrucomicrobiota bacterium]
MSDYADVPRRGFLTRAGIVAGAAMPGLIPSHALAARKGPGASDRDRIGVIGVGNRAGLLMDQLPKAGSISWRPARGTGTCSATSANTNRRQP